FPEGTSSAGREVLPFHPSMLAAATRASLPVSWAALSYRTSECDAPASESVCWWGTMSFLPHLWALLGLERIEATVCFGARTLADGDRKRLAGALHTEVVAALARARASG